MRIDQFTEAEQEALRWAQKGELVTKIPDRTVKDVFGAVEAPGRSVFKKLVKLGLLFESEEDEDWTPMLCLTEEGERLTKGLL